MEKSRLEKVKIIFASNPKIDKIYLCEDDQAFASEDAANDHAKGIGKKSVLQLTRELVKTLSETKPAKASKEVGDKEVKTTGAATTTEGGGADDDTTGAATTTEGGGADGGDGGATEETDAEKEKAALVAEYTALAGKAPAANIKVDTLKAKIEELKNK